MVSLGHNVLKLVWWNFYIETLQLLFQWLNSLRLANPKCWVINYSDNVLVPAQHQAITWMSAELNFKKQTVKFKSKFTDFLSGKTLENFICKMVAIMFHPEYVNWFWAGVVISFYRSGSTLIKVMASCQTAPSHNVDEDWFFLFGKPFKHISEKFCVIFRIFISSKIIWKCCLQNDIHFVLGSMYKAANT